MFLRDCNVVGHITPSSFDRRSIHDHRTRSEMLDNFWDHRPISRILDFCAKLLLLFKLFRNGRKAGVFYLVMAKRTKCTWRGIWEWIWCLIQILLVLHFSQFVFVLPRYRPGGERGYRPSKRNPWDRVILVYFGALISEIDVIRANSGAFSP